MTLARSDRAGASRLRRVLTFLVPAAAVLAMGGCAVDAEQAGRDDAAAAAAAVTWYVREHVVIAGRRPALLRADLSSFFRDPGIDALRATAFPTLHVLADARAGVTVVFYAYGRPPPMGGGSRAWGHVCVRYGVSPGNELDATDVACTGDLPTEPRPGWRP